MRITYDTLTLCDGAVRGVGKNVGVENFRIADRRSVQVAPIVGAAQQRVFARGNLLVNVSFDVHREHSDVAAAESYCVQLYASLPESGKLTVGSVGGSGGLAKVDFSGAVLEASEHRYSGVRSYHHYDFVIGAA